MSIGRRWMSDIELLIARCQACQVYRSMPAEAPPHPLEPATRPWQRVHVDFCGPCFPNKMFLVLVDQYTRWPEVIMMNSTSTEATLDALREVFKTFGFPETLFSDNGPQFREDNSLFQSWMTRWGVRTMRSAPYSPKATA